MARCLKNSCNFVTKWGFSLESCSEVSWQVSQRMTLSADVIPLLEKMMQTSQTILQNHNVLMCRDAL